MKSDYLFLIILLSASSIVILYYGAQVTETQVYDTAENLKERLKKTLHNTMPECCTELTKECFACAAGVMVHDFCERHQGQYGCPQKIYPCKKTKTSGQRVITKTNPPFFIYTHPYKDDVYVSGSLQKKGMWEPHFISQFEAMLNNYPTAHVVDIGSNIGMYSLFASAKGHKVFAFEPLQINLQRQCNSIIDNKLDIKLYGVALSNRPTKVKFQPLKQNVGGTKTIEDNDINILEGEEHKDYAMAYTLDSFNIPNDQPVIMKIDIEGSECEMMQGATKFFKTHDVKGILMEWGQVAKRCSSINDIIKTLSTHLTPYNANGKVQLLEKDKPWKKHWDVVWKVKPKVKPKVEKVKRAEKVKPKVKKVKAKFIAQAGQDKYVDSKFSDKKVNTGTFVEFGGLKGDEYSNTFYFEKAYNWRGIMIEAEKKYIPHLKQVRDATIYNNAVCPSGMKEVKFASSKIMGWSGIADHVDDPRWTNKIDKIVTVQCVDLNNVLKEQNMFHVDYMTVDTEGSELAILKTFDFDTFDVTFVQVERNVKTKAQRDEKDRLIRFMKSKGYGLEKVFNIGNQAVDVLFRKIPKWVELWGKKDKNKYDTVANIMRELNSVNIDSFLMAGSALGAYRNHGWYHWDKDADILLMSIDLKKIEASLKRLKLKHSYTSFGYHVHIPGVTTAKPYIDLWLFQEKNNKVKCVGAVGTKENCNDFCRVVDRRVCSPMPKKWLYPPQWVPYGPYLLPTIRQEYVDWKYGSKWMTHCGKKPCTAYFKTQQFVFFDGNKETVKKNSKVLHTCTKMNGKYTCINKRDK